MTPGEIATLLREESKRLHAEAQARLALAWHTATFVRARKMPRLATLLGVDRPTQADIEQAREEHEDLIERLG